MGRKPTSTKAKVLQGTWRPDRANPDEPTPPPGLPPRPSHLKGHARREWERLCGLLDALNVLVEAHGPAIESAALAYERMRQAQASIQKHGMTKGSGSGLTKNPMLSVEARARKDWEGSLVRLGLTPTDMPRLKMRTAAPVKGEAFDFAGGKR